VPRDSVVRDSVVASDNQYRCNPPQAAILAAPIAPPLDAVGAHPIPEDAYGERMRAAFGAFGQPIQMQPHQVAILADPIAPPLDAVGAHPIPGAAFGGFGVRPPPAYGAWDDPDDDL